MTSYVLFNKGLPVALVDSSPYTGTPKLNDFFDATGTKIAYDKAENSRSLKSYAEANEAAAAFTTIYGKTFIPVDDGPGTSHRYGVIGLPEIGDEVSYSFNGDTYPCGKITRITPTLRVTATDARGNKIVFNRFKESGGWKRVGGTWWMVKGSHYEQNPHF